MIAATMTLAAAPTATAQTIVPQNLAQGGTPAPLVLVQASEDQRDFIMTMQRNLQTLGLYTAGIDGVAGPGTWRAIREFYRLAGIDRSDGFGRDEYRILKHAVGFHEDDGMNRNKAIRAAANPRLAAADTFYENGVKAYADGDYEGAEESWRKVLSVHERVLGPEHPHTLISMNNLAVILGLQGRHTEAETLEREVIAAHKRLQGPEHPETLSTMNNLASSLMLQGRYAEAEALARELIAARKRVLGPRHPDTLNTMNNFALTLKHRGQYAEAEALEREVIAARKRVLGPEHLDTLGTMANLAGSLRYQSRHSEAEALTREVIAARKRLQGPDHPETLKLMITLAGSLNEQGRYAEAEALTREVIAALKRVLEPDHPYTLGAMHNLAISLSMQGRYAEAEALEREAIAASKRALGTEHPKTLSLMGNLAMNLRHQGRYAEAEALQREVIAARKRVLGPEHPDTFLTRQNLSITLVETSDVPAALDALEDGFEHIPAALAASGEPPLDLARYLELGWSSSQIPESALSARTFPAQGYLTYGTLDVSLGAQAARRQVQDKAAADALREFQDAQEARTRLRRAYLAIFEQGSGATEDARARIKGKLDAAEDRFAAISARMRRDFPTLAELQLPRALSAEEAQDLLETGEGLLAFASTEDHLYAWLVTQEGIEWQRMDTPRADLAERVAHLRAGLDVDAEQPPELERGCALRATDPALARWPYDLCAAQELHNIVLGKFDLSGIEELIVVPDGPLETLPFSVMVTDRGADGRLRWLIEDHAITTLPTTSSLRALRQGDVAQRGDDRRPFLGIAPVEFDSSGFDSPMRGAALPSLPGTGDEVRLISAILGAGRDGTVIGPAASEANIKSADLSRYEVLSFATHGLLSREAEERTDGRITEMALALGAGDGEDGFLTASEAATLRLNADWVLLSACNTAAGSGDDAQGLSGLARAFFFAGARAMMVTHWYIDDEVTPALIGDTMERYATRDDISRAQALRQAQLAMLSDREHAHPYYWAPFSVVGDNR